jgi:hypothetical protein
MDMGRDRLVFPTALPGCDVGESYALNVWKIKRVPTNVCHTATLMSERWTLPKLRNRKPAYPISCFSLLWRGSQEAIHHLKYQKMWVLPGSGDYVLKVIQRKIGRLICRPNSL